MTQNSQIAIEHVVVESSRPYEEVTKSLEARLGDFRDPGQLRSALAAGPASWDQITQLVEKQHGPSGFALFHKVEHGELLSLAGKPHHVSQYAIGNALLAVQMVEHAPAVALYAPLRLAVYADGNGKTMIAYDRISSQLSQFQNSDVARIAALVEQKLDSLIADVTHGWPE